MLNIAPETLPSGRRWLKCVHPVQDRIRYFIARGKSTGTLWPVRSHRRKRRTRSLEWSAESRGGCDINGSLDPHFWHHPSPVWLSGLPLSGAEWIVEWRPSYRVGDDFQDSETLHSATDYQRFLHHLTISQGPIMEKSRLIIDLMRFVLCDINPDRKYNSRHQSFDKYFRKKQKAFDETLNDGNPVSSSRQHVQKKTELIRQVAHVTLWQCFIKCHIRHEQTMK